MELLPNKVEDFTSNEYWSEFFREYGKENGRSFEWYGEFEELEDLLTDSILRSGDWRKNRGREEIKILHIGCGNSSIGADLYDKGFRNIVNIDFSAEAINAMIKKNKSRKEMKWLCIDVEKDFQSYVNCRSNFGQFDVILDKGFLDAYLSIDTGNCPDKSNYNLRSKEYLSASLSLLKHNGKYILVTLGQDYVSKALSLNLYKSGCEIQVEPLVNVKETKYLPYYVEITNKGIEFGGDSSQYKLREMTTDLVENNRRNYKLRNETHYSIWTLAKKLKEISAMYWDSKHISLLSPGEVREYQLNLGSSKNLFITVYDTPNSRMEDESTIALLVPPGEEQDWLYSTKEGMEEISRQAKCKRLIVVSRLNECVEKEFDKEVGDKDSLAKERELVSEISSFLSPFALKSSKGSSFPVLTVGAEEKSRTKRRCIYNCDSNYSNKILVYEIENEPSVTTTKKRQMIFKSSPRLIQSEVTLIKKESGDFAFDYTKDLSNYYIGVFLLSCLVVTCKEMSNNEGVCNQTNTLILGLGGGVLPTILKNQHGNGIKITAIEIDEKVKDVAVSHFGLDENNVNVLIKDAFDHVDAVLNSKEEKYDFIIVDINSSNVNDSLMCPDAKFTTFDFVNKLIKISTQNCFIVFNVSCRDSNRRRELFCHMNDAVTKSCGISSKTDSTDQRHHAEKDSNGKNSLHRRDPLVLKAIETGDDEVNELWVIKREQISGCNDTLTKFVSENKDIFSKRDNEDQRDSDIETKWIQRLSGI